MDTLDRLLDRFLEMRLAQSVTCLYGRMNWSQWMR